MRLRIAGPMTGSVLLVTVRDVERRQPGFATNRPAFVRGFELVDRVEAASVQFELLAEAVEQRRAAGGAEVSRLVFTRLAGDRHGIRGEDSEAVEDRALPPAAIEAMADADPVGFSRNFD